MIRVEEQTEHVYAVRLGIVACVIAERLRAAFRPFTIQRNVDREECGDF